MNRDLSHLAGEPMTFITAPRVHLIGEMVFHKPQGIDLSFLGDASGGERLIEFAGRSCYQSFHNPGGKTNREYVDNIEEQRHGSVLEHDAIALYVEGVSRNLTHEQVRHRAGWAYSQLSQRYVDESEAAFVIPPDYLLDTTPEGLEELEEWKLQCLEDRAIYVEHTARRAGRLARRHPELTPVEVRKRVREATRSKLPGATETKIVMTGNMRAWRHALEMRASEHADREICRLYAVHVFPILKVARPNVFQDFETYTGRDGRLALRNTYRKV